MEPGNKVEVPHRRDRRKKSPGVSAKIAGDIIRRDRLIKWPGVLPALRIRLSDIRVNATDFH